MNDNIIRNDNEIFSSKTSIFDTTIIYSKIYTKPESISPLLYIHQPSLSLGKESVLYPDQCAFLWKISWLSLISSIYAIVNGHYDMAIVPGGVFITSINYWRDPVYSSWRRKVDINYIAIALTYQSVRAYTAEYARIYYWTMLLGIAFYPLSYHYYYKQLYWKSTYCHSMVHIIANIANIILYSGYIMEST
jgi:hypothetical protein